METKCGLLSQFLVETSIINNITLTIGECDLVLPSAEITCLCEEDSSEVLKCFLTSEAVMVQDMVNIDTGLELGAASTHNTLNTGQLRQVLHSTNIF